LRIDAYYYWRGQGLFDDPKASPPAAPHINIILDAKSLGYEFPANPNLTGLARWQWLTNQGSGLVDAVRSHWNIAVDTGLSKVQTDDVFVGPWKYEYPTYARFWYPIRKHVETTMDELSHAIGNSILTSITGPPQDGSDAARKAKTMDNLKFIIENYVYYGAYDVAARDDQFRETLFGDRRLYDSKEIINILLKEIKANINDQRVPITADFDATLEEVKKRGALVSEAIEKEFGKDDFRPAAPAFIEETIAKLRLARQELTTH
jgi:hypothetical protein